MQVSYPTLLIISCTEKIIINSENRKWYSKKINLNWLKISSLANWPSFLLHFDSVLQKYHVSQILPTVQKMLDEEILISEI